MDHASATVIGEEGSTAQFLADQTIIDRFYSAMVLNMAVWTDEGGAVLVVLILVAEAAFTAFTRIPVSFMAFKR